MSTKSNRRVGVLISAMAVIGGFGYVGLSAAVAQSGPLEQATRLYESGDYRTAASLLLPLAQGGDARCQLRLATLYRTGKGVEEDEYLAAYWFTKAAHQGVAEAQFHLGLMYLYGLGVTQDAHRAMEWISLAAEQGFGDAEDLYGYMLANDEPLAC